MKIRKFRGQATVLFLITTIVAITYLSSSCSKSASNAQIQVRLVDNPAVNVKAVWVDIQQIEIITSAAGPVMLTGIHPGMYNLMDLTNGNDTLLADAVIPAGKMSQLRLILGDNNYIIDTAGQKISLKTPSAQQSGLKVQIHEDLSGGILYRLTLDFDAARSIVPAGNSGDINLKPVLRVLSFAPSGGNIQGVVLPGNIPAAIFAINGNDTIATTFTNPPSGGFLIKDIPAGNYQLSIVPTDATYQPVQKTAVVVLGQSTVVDTVHLQY